MKLYLYALLLAATVTAYNIVPNPDAGSFQIFPLVNLGPAAFPTSMAFSSDGRIFVAQKNGVVRVIDANGNLDPVNWIDLSYTVMNSGDKGLTSLVLHPNFPATPYVYVTYPIWQGTDAWNRDLNRVTQGVLARYTEVNGRGSMDSQFLLVGKTNGTGFPSCHNSHVTGEIVFANDGTLFISAGEGSHWDAVDDGSIFDFDPYDWQCAPFFGKDVAIGSFRAQHKNNLGGKVIRIDPATGNGIGPDNFPNLMPNPFYDASNPSSFSSVIWTYGHRNPWKLTLGGPTAYGPGTLYVGEVGAKDYEEINVIKPSQAGSNYGWPCQIANRRPQPWFTNTSVPTEYYVPVYPTNANTVQQCQLLQPNLTNSVEPLIYWSRTQVVNKEFIGIIGNCASGLTFYNHTSYPESYRPQADGTRTLFISDYGNQWIKAIRVDKNDNYLDSYGIQDFLESVGSLVQVITSPLNGDLHYVTVAGEIARIRYTVGYVGAPVINEITSTPTTLNIANRPAVFQFNSDGTFDPSGLPLTFAWDFGDGQTSSKPNPTHTYTTSSTFNVKLTVTNSASYTTSQTISVATNNDAPVVNIAGPAFYSFYAGQNVTNLASFTDSETNSNDIQSIWHYTLIHNNHYHPDVFPGFVNTANSSFTKTVLSDVISQWERNMLEISVTATDTSGASTTQMVRAVPDYPGNVNVDSNATPVPAFKTSQVGGNTVLFDAGDTTDADVDYLVYTWSWGDGLNGTGQVNYHTYTAPGTYTATLTAMDPWLASATLSQRVVVKPAVLSTVPATATNVLVGSQRSSATSVVAGGIAFVALLLLA